MRVVFLCRQHYFKNVKTNVSNARTNIPKAIRSLKSNGFLSISTTPILCKNRGQPPYIIDNLSSPWYSYHNSGGAVYVSDNFLMEN